MSQELSKQDFLLEIGCEEIPARFIDALLRQLKNKFSAWLSQSNIDHGEILLYSTPRRLSILIKEVASYQSDLNEEVRGPSLHLAKDQEGEWSQAARGFVQKYGMQVDDLHEMEFKGANYLALKLHHKGRLTQDILLEGVPEILNSLELPYAMRWGELGSSKRFVRPVRWLLSLFGSSQLPIKWAGLTASNNTYGHILSEKSIVLDTPSNYESLLEENHVIVSEDKRRALIIDQLKQLEHSRDCSVPIEEDLIDEVVNLVEYPVAVLGKFNEEYLSIPREVLITTMKEHQRYFYVENKVGDLQPYFVTVSNNYNANQAAELITHGNERVLHARLADADFFYKEDISQSLTSMVEKLDRISACEELGTLAAKQKRLVDVFTLLGKELEKELALTSDNFAQLLRAASCCKFVTVTKLAGEFPELESELSYIYAKQNNEDSEVASAISEHYLPKASSGKLPQSKIGSLLSLIDKLDTVASNFGIDRKPTGSQDPYGLRRQTIGLISILLQDEYSTLNLSNLCKIVIDRLNQDALLKVEAQQVYERLLNFCELRLKRILKDENIRDDIIQAVLASGIEYPKLVVEKARLLNKQSEFPGQEAFVRLSNLAKQADVSTELEAGLFQTEYETNLYQLLQKCKSSIFEVEEYYEELLNLSQGINELFDNVLVMTDDIKVRHNRLILLSKTNERCTKFATFTKLST